MSSLNSNDFYLQCYSCAFIVIVVVVSCLCSVNWFNLVSPVCLQFQIQRQLPDQGQPSQFV